MITELFAANEATTTVTSGGTTAPAQGTSESWTVASSAMFGAAATGVSQFHVSDPALPSEVIAVTNVSGTTWTVTRGSDGTTPVAHTSGFTVNQVITKGWLTNPGALWYSLYTAPSGALGETYPRTISTLTSTTPTSGVLQLTLIGLPAGLTVTNITMATGANVKTGGTHGWYCILDSSLTLRGVTADQTDAATVWGVAGTAYTLALATPYVTTYSGYYYLGFMATQSAGSMPNFCCTQALATGVQTAPAPGGTSTNGLSTPGTVGTTTYSAPSNTGKPYYGYVS